MVAGAVDTRKVVAVAVTVATGAIIKTVTVQLDMEILTKVALILGVMGLVPTAWDMVMEVDMAIQSLALQEWTIMGCSSSSKVRGDRVLEEGMVLAAFPTRMAIMARSHLGEGLSKVEGSSSSHTFISSLLGSRVPQLMLEQGVGQDPGSRIGQATGSRRINIDASSLCCFSTPYTI